MTTNETSHRPLYVIARDIRANWHKPYFGAVPYLEAMGSLNGIRDSFYEDDAKGIVLYFLANSGNWRGDAARRIKAELKMMAGVR